MTEMTSYLGWTLDYANPAGAPAFLGPDSVHWRIYKNPIALAVGGVAAVLLEFADARIRSGVWDHSTYKVDPIGRSKRTGVAAMVGVYGPQAAARRVIQGVTNMHARVNGETPKGEAYKALDPELLDWVSATAAYGFL
ncbi:MAG TPA: oxygenase MpaB family protein, partial [Phenylobacterium sp.]|nr:oxygenase MpaB family protein [Phenylobacterium sp.]